MKEVLGFTRGRALKCKLGLRCEFAANNVPRTGILSSLATQPIVRNFLSCDNEHTEWVLNLSSLDSEGLVKT